MVYRTKYLSEIKPYYESDLVKVISVYFINSTT